MHLKTFCSVCLRPAAKRVHPRGSRWECHSQRLASEDHTWEVAPSLGIVSLPPSPGEAGRQITGPITDSSNLDGKTSMVLLKSMSWPRPHHPPEHLWAVISNAMSQMGTWVTQALYGFWSFLPTRAPGGSNMKPVFRCGFCYNCQQDQVRIFSISF